MTKDHYFTLLFLCQSHFTVNTASLHLAHVVLKETKESHADLGVCVEHCPVGVSRLAFCHPGMMPFIMRKLKG